MFLEAETVCSQDSEVPSAWIFVQSLSLWYGMQELKAVVRIDEYISSHTTFSHSSAVCLLSLADEGVTKHTILFEAVVISTVATLSSVCALNYQSTSYSITSTINSKCHSKPCSQVCMQANT